MTRDIAGTSLRRALDDARRRGRVGRSGTVSVRFDPTASAHRFAFAIGRRVGPAVVRNRVRRRMRAVVAEVGGDLPAGTYLFSAGPEVVGLSFEEMRNAMNAALERAVAARSARGSRGDQG